MDYGINLFGCIKEFHKSPKNFFRQVSQMGYTRIEPCIVFGDPLAYGEEIRNHLWTLEETAEYVSLLESYGMKMDSFHAFGDLLSNMKDVVETLETYQIKHMIMGGPADKEREFEAYVDRMRQIAEKIKKTKAKLLIHNGMEEISVKIGAESFLEAFLKAEDGLIGCQIDLGWALYGGMDPIDCLNRVKPWCESVHYKDIRKDYKEIAVSDIHVCLGEGALDVRASREWSMKYDLPQYIDQDISTDWMRDLKKSIELLR